ncbi:MAG: hypothetical protein ACLPJY_17965 [Rhodomicrobium sp.]
MASSAAPASSASVAPSARLSMAVWTAPIPDNILLPQQQLELRRHPDPHGERAISGDYASPAHLQRFADERGRLRIGHFLLARAAALELHQRELAGQNLALRITKSRAKAQYRTGGLAMRGCIYCNSRWEKPAYIKTPILTTVL